MNARRNNRAKRGLAQLDAALANLHEAWSTLCDLDLPPQAAGPAILDAVSKTTKARELYRQTLARMPK